MLLEIKDLTVHYDKLEILKGISLDVQEGTIVTLLGANGAGKTTTLRTISGLKACTRGEIWLDGRRIDRLSPEEIVRAGIAHVPEGRRAFPRMSVMENLMMGAYLNRERRASLKKRLDEILEHFPVLRQRHTQSAGRMSGGEQQMLVIARALMSRPRLLLLDEPTLGLSPLMAQEVARIAKDVLASGFGVVLVEQNAKVALNIAQKGYVMETGRIVMEGSTQELVSNSEYVKHAYLGG